MSAEEIQLEMHIVCLSTLSGHRSAFQLRLFRGILSILPPIRPGKWRNLELQIGRRFRGRVLRIHPFGLSLRSFCLPGTLSQALMHRAHLRSPEMTERSSRKVKLLFLVCRFHGVPIRSVTIDTVREALRCIATYSYKGGMTSDAEKKAHAQLAEFMTKGF